MLYATTRNQQDSYTAQRALTQQCAPDGGYYVPYREPCFYPSQIREMGQLSFQDTLARMLNFLFGCKLTPWDIEFTTGKHPVRFEKIGRRSVAVERWHNTAWTFQGMVSDLTAKIQTQLPENQQVGVWAEIGVGIASLFGIFSQLFKVGVLNPGDTVDVAVSADSLLSAVSAWYCKSWGLPVGTIVCSCRESNGLWDLFHNGTLKAGSIPEKTSQFTWADGLEILLCACGGQGESRRYLDAVSRGKAYVPSDPVLLRLRERMAVSVISERRMLETIPAASSTHHYILSPDGALAYAGLLDYRAVSGSNGWGMVLCDRSPGLDLTTLERALGLSEEEVKSLIHYH